MGCDGMGCRHRLKESCRGLRLSRPVWSGRAKGCLPSRFSLRVGVSAAPNEWGNGLGEGAYPTYRRLEL